MQTAMFQLDQARAKINGVNVRSELHGQEHVPACDISMTVKMSNDVLAFFDPALKGLLYSRDTDKSKQGDMLGGVSDAPVLRFPLLGMPLQWDWEGVGYCLTIHYGVTGQDIVLDVGVGKIRLECLDGGTVELTFRAQAHPEESQIGRLAMLIQCDATITLEPPKAGATASDPMFGDGQSDEPPAKNPKRSRKGREEAEQAFT